MKRIITLLLFLSGLISYGQIQQNAPWAKDLLEKERSTGKLTLQEISEAAEAYFNTVDKFKKASGYKPFKRWEYNWSKFLNPDGIIKSRKDLWKAWEEKQAMNQSSRMTDLSDWQALGPYMNSNTYNANNFKQTGQGRINAIAVDPSNSDTYYVGAPSGGIWKSTDAGLNWTPLVDHLPQIGVSGIAIHPTNSDIIYIATGDDDANDSSSVGVWKSEDGGTTWNNTGNLPGNPINTHEIFIDPNTPEIVVVATSLGVMKTTNSGDTWVNKLNGNIRDLRVKAGDPSTYYAVTNFSFHVSNNTAESFTRTSLPDLGGSSRLAMGVGGVGSGENHVYVVSADQNNEYNAFYKSTDAGQTFTKLSTPDMFGGSTQAWFDLALTVSSNNPDIVYVGVLDIFKSTNGGNSFTRLNFWNNPNQSSYTHADIHFLRFIDGKFFAGTDGGIFVSTDEGVNFTDLTKNLAISQFYRISVSPHNSQSVAGGLQDNGGFGYKNGVWRNYHGADGMEGVVDPNNEDKYYGFIQFGRQLNITNNAGESLAQSILSPTNGNTRGEWITPLSINSMGELFCGYQQLHRLDNGNWIPISSHTEFIDVSRGLDVIEIDPNNDDIIIVSNGASVFRSVDKGITFTTLLSISLGTVFDIEFSNSDSNTVWLATTNGVFKSVNILDTTPTATNITGNLPSDTKLTIKHHERSDNNTIYLGTSLGVYYTSDDLNEWIDFDNNLPNTQVRDLAIHEDDAKLIAATYGRGTFITDIPRQLPNNDVRLLTIIKPNNGIACGNNITPEIIIKNQGLQEITSVSINYDIDGGTSSNFTWSGNLATETTTTITLPEITNFSPGSHAINIDVTITDDTYAENNSRVATFTLNKTSNNPTTLNSFETSNDELLVETTNETVWERGNVNKTLLSVPSGANAYATKLTGNYPNQTTGYLYTNCYDLSLLDNPELAFKMGFDIENEFDYMLVEYSTNFGADWSILGTANDPNWYNNAATQTSQGVELPGAQWTGLGGDNHNDGMPNATIRDYSHDLSAFTNETNIIFRFKFFTDQNTNGEGVVIDDLTINGTLSTNSFSLLNDIAIYPNPSESIFNLNWNTGEVLDIRVFDITGKQIFSKRNINQNSYQLDLAGFAKGIYLLNMNMNGKTATKKLVLK